MASLPSHATAALALGSCFYRSEIPKRVWVLGAFVAMLPDADVLAFRFGIPYQHLFGHRDFTHSLVFALLAAASHGALDAKMPHCTSKMHEGTFEMHQGTPKMHEGIFKMHQGTDDVQGASPTCTRASSTCIRARTTCRGALSPSSG
jgi:hypothetical protein